MAGTRSRTKSEAAKPVSAKPVSSRPTRTTRSGHAISSAPADEAAQSRTEKENKRTKPKSTTPRVTMSSVMVPPRKTTRATVKKEYCTCRQPDDGTPMVHCSECKDWYHFRCVDLKERDAEDISIYHFQLDISIPPYISPSSSCLAISVVVVV
ncbi:hypothetical protein PLICRDRAFT_253082 [Plicaturopsis crispa FD-325 SS-3]|nr:hypothetical protein PLICRDRAFT_253082 [Plicaturopsis crispa FD-325 SS-3]